MISCEKEDPVSTSPTTRQTDDSTTDPTDPDPDPEEDLNDLTALFHKIYLIEVKPFLKYILDFKFDG